MKKLLFAVLAVSLLALPTAALADDAPVTDEPAIDAVRDKVIDRVTDLVTDRVADRASDRWSERHRRFHRLAARCLYHHGIDPERLTHRRLHHLGRRCLLHHNWQRYVDFPL